MSSPGKFRVFRSEIQNLPPYYQARFNVFARFGLVDVVEDMGTDPEHEKMSAGSGGAHRKNTFRQNTTAANYYGGA